MIRIAFLAVLAIGCASSGSAPSASVAPAAPETTARTIPPTVGDLTLATSRKFPTADMGAMHRYGSGNFRPDVYVYPQAGWPNAQRQAQDFLQTLEIYKSRGEFDSYEVLLTQPITITAAGQNYPGHEIVMRLSMRGQPRDSYFSVVALPDNRYAKTRITQAPDEKAVERARNFVNDWVASYVK